MKTKCDVDIQGMKESDLDTAILMLKETVRKVNRSDYSQGEIALWLHRVNKDKWLHRINHDFFIKAVDANRMVGFASLKGGNYIDLLYVDADYQRQGIASQLLHSMIKKGVHDGKKVFQTHASKTARPFFTNKGFRTVKSNTVGDGVINLTNYLMELKLG